MDQIRHHQLVEPQTERSIRPVNFKFWESGKRTRYTLF